MTVHPHGCGEGVEALRVVFADGGSSPRVWGRLRGRWPRGRPRRFIPTGVGKAGKNRNRPLATAVHPHGCGEGDLSCSSVSSFSGSSPRVWGRRNPKHHFGDINRFIPTGVGKALSQMDSLMRPPVHPHGCGEGQDSGCAMRRMAGSSPRVWGRRFGACSTSAGRRFIPTGVGKARSARWCRAGPSVHPHGCGEGGMERAGR